MTSTFAEYINSVRDRHTRKGTLRIPMESEIRSRWNSRVLPRALHSQGASGAAVYLRDYGRGISAPKVEALALYAEEQGEKAFAQGFWAKAFELTFGMLPPEEERTLLSKSTDTGGNEERESARLKVAQADETKQHEFPSLPSHLQPGKIVTMQPVDAPKDVESYLRDPAFVAQPKRDGVRCVVLVEADGTAVEQTRTGRVEPVSSEWRPALSQVAKQYGAFVLDGERYFQDAFGKEHRTGAQAATANINAGKPEGEVIERYAVFKALFVGDKDLTAWKETDHTPLWMEIDRIRLGYILAQTLEELDGRTFEALPTSETTSEKTALLEKQKAEGREGVVFVRGDCKYVGGKSNGTNAPFVRYKFLRTLDVIITGLTRTTAAGRAFGAIDVSAFVNGKLTKLGAVGTGFTQDQARELAALHGSNPGGVVIEIASQGFTENGQVWHARYLGVRPDKATEGCEVVL